MCIRDRPRTSPDRYEMLKKALRLTYGKTQHQRHIELIKYAATEVPVLDVKPSNMLMYIQDLAGDSKEQFERAVLLNRLPNSVRTTLASSSAASNEELALEADRIMESFLLARPGCTPASVLAMEAAPAAPIPQGPSGYPMPSPCQVAAVGTGPTRGTDQSFLCFIHAKYGAKAYSCKSKRCPMHHLVQKRSGNAGAGR